MYQAYEATIDQAGNVHLKEPLQLAGQQQALVIVLDSADAPVLNEAYLLSEASLAADWNRP